MKSAAAFIGAESETAGRSTVRLFVVLLLAGVVVSAVLSTLVLIWVPTSGQLVSINDGRVDAVEPGWVAARAGLRTGDVLAPNTPFFQREALANFNYFRPTDFSFDVIRNGGTQHVRLRVNQFDFDHANPTGIEIFFLAANVVIFLVCALIGTFVVLVRPSRMTWAFFLYCLGAVLPIAVAGVLSLVPLPLGFVLEMARITLFVAGLFALPTFALRFPGDELRGWRRRIAAMLPFFGAAFAISIYLSWIVPLYPTGFNSGVLDYANMAVTVAVCALSIVSAVGVYRSSLPATRARLRWAIIGVVLGAFALASRAILIGLDQFWNFEWLGWGTLLGGFFAPLAVAYAILKHRVIDVRFVINRAAVYLAITSLLAVTLGAAYWITNLFLQHTQIAALLQLIFAIAAGVGLHKVYRRLDSVINRILFRRRYEAQEQLQRISDGLARVESVRELELLVAMEPVLALELVAGAVYHKNERGDYERLVGAGGTWPTLLPGDEPIVTRARAHREPFTIPSGLLSDLPSELHGHAIAFAMPLHANKTLAALALYGPHCNGTDLDPGERAAIGSLQSPAERSYEALYCKSLELRKLAELLQTLPEDSDDKAYVYLATEMIAAIPERMRTALTAVAGIPNATNEELALATQDPRAGEALREFATVSAGLRLHDEKPVELHGLLRRELASTYREQRVTMLSRCAHRAAELHDHARASQLFELAECPAAAVRERERELANRDASVLFDNDGRARILAGVDFDIIAQCPNVWIKQSMQRLYRDAALLQAREGWTVWNSTQNGESHMLLPWCAYLQAETGDLSGASATLQARRIPELSFAGTFQCIVSSLINGRLGKLRLCAEELKAETVDGIAFDTYRGLALLVRASTIERARGRWNSERAEMERAIESFKMSGSPFLLAALAEGVAGAWLAGKWRTFKSHLKELEDSCVAHEARTLFHLVSVASGQCIEPLGIEAPRWLAYAYLMSVSNSETWDAAASFAELALEAALRANEPLLQILARVACAHFEEERSDEHLRRAMDLTGQIDSVELRGALHDIIAEKENAGMLQHFFSQLRRVRKTTHGALAIDVATGSVRRRRCSVPLSERELALTVALARSRTATPASELCDLIWPDLDETTGLHALQTCVHRLRQRLNDPGSVENTAQGYRLRDDTVIDLFQIEMFLRNLPVNTGLDQFSTLRLAAVAKHLDGGRPAYMSRWEWFSPIERRINEWSRAAKYRLAQEAIHLHDFDRALELSEELRTRDELDEGAWEIALRALVESGNRTEAQRALRRYREITLRELGEEPSPELYSLLEPTASHAKLRVSR